MLQSFTTPAGSDRSLRLSEETIKSPRTSGNSLATKFNYFHNAKIAVKFEGSCLKQIITSFSYTNVMKLFIAYEFNIWTQEIETLFSRWVIIILV